MQSALNAYNYTYNVSARFISPERLSSGAARGGTRAGLTSIGRLALEVEMNQREEQKIKYRTAKNCKESRVTVKAIPWEPK